MNTGKENNQIISENLRVLLREQKVWGRGEIGKKSTQISRVGINAPMKKKIKFVQPRC